MRIMSLCRFMLLMVVNKKCQKYASAPHTHAVAISYLSFAGIVSLCSVEFAAGGRIRRKTSAITCSAFHLIIRNMRNIRNVFSFRFLLRKRKLLFLIKMNIDRVRKNVWPICSFNLRTNNNPNNNPTQSSDARSKNFCRTIQLYRRKEATSWQQQL